MDKKNLIYMNVVGIDHYLKDGAKERLFEKLEQIMHDSKTKHAPYVNFEWDRQNKFAPACFVAKYNYQKIGSLESDMVDEAIAAMDKHGRFSGFIHEWWHKSITVAVEDNDGKLRQMAVTDKCNDRITTSALDGIGRMEYLERENEFEERTDDLLEFVEHYRTHNLAPDDKLVDMFNAWKEVYESLHRRTMCREDHGVIKRMRILLEPLQDVEHDAFYDDSGHLLAEIDTAYNEAYTLHRHTVQNNGPLEIMTYQLDHLRDIAHQPGGFIDDYKKVYLHKADQEKIRDEYDRIEQWLRTALPYNVYARYVDDKVKLASNLFYLRLTRAELYNVYEHMLVLEELEHMLKGDVPSEQPKASVSEQQPLQPNTSAKLRNAEARREKANAYFHILKMLHQNNAFASGISTEWIKDQIMSHLLNKVEDEDQQLLRDQVWVEIENTRKESINYKGAMLPRFLEIIGLWCVQSHIILGVSKLADLISVKIQSPESKETIRVQIQNSINKVKTTMDKPQKLPLIIQLFMK